jgi:Asp-tRNA(Asn)/Glu-tRNA(Gln) amidotransferase C subunit
MELEKVLQNAPETDGPFFKVPKVIGGDEDSAG